jgi:hypothetical protein
MGCFRLCCGRDSNFVAEILKSMKFSIVHRFCSCIKIGDTHRSDSGSAPDISTNCSIRRPIYIPSVRDSNILGLDMNPILIEIYINNIIIGYPAFNMPSDSIPFGTRKLFGTILMISSHCLVKFVGHQISFAARMMHSFISSYQSS